MHPHARRASRRAPASPASLLLLSLLALARPGRAHEFDQSYAVNTTLRCCTIPEPPIIIENVKSGDGATFAGFGGIGIKYLNLLTEITGLRCGSLERYTRAHDLGATAVTHGGNEFDNFVAKMHECTVPDGEHGVVNASDPSCRCDIGVGGWAINEKRLGLVSFLPPFVSDNFMVVTHVDNTIPDAGVFFLRTFDFDVWITIVALLVVFTMLKFLDSDFSPWRRPRDDHTGSTSMRRFLTKGRVPFRLRKALQSTVGHMTGAPSTEIDGEYGTFRQGLLNFIIFLCGLFLVLIYGSSMTASIVQESFGSDYRDINDFKLCRIPTNDVCLVGGDGVELFWNMSIARHECHREEGWASPRVFASGDYMDGLQAAANGSCKYVVGLGSTLRYGIQRGFCGRLVFTGEPFFAEGVSFVLPHRSEFMFRLSKATLALKNDDRVQTVLDFFEDDDDCLPERPKSLTFKKLRWFFFLAYGACVLLFFAMVLDRRRAKPDPDANVAASASAVAAAAAARAADPEAGKFAVPPPGPVAPFSPRRAAPALGAAHAGGGPALPKNVSDELAHAESAESDERRGSSSSLTSQPQSRDAPPGQ